ncbi:MAG: hypothetical protein P4L90_05200 [Rhodopila sp.]|nr:hypothetical protein [Rhodopila sp.]
MIRSSTRVFLGCVAGAIAVLAFHQTTLQVFFWLGWVPQAAFRIAQVPPFNAPLVVSITFWGAVYGGAFGFLLPWLRGPLWLNGMAAGIGAMLLAWFVFLPLMGHEAAFGWQPWPMLRSAIAYQMWGIGMSLVLPLLHPRRLGGRQSSWNGHRLVA